MPQYTCPSCHTILKRDQPVPAGKKIRCPKCESVFEPGGKAAAPASGKPAAARPASKKIDSDFDEDRNPYRVMDHEEEDEAMREQKERAAKGLIRDRFEKSARGPAGRELVRPANFLMAVGVFRGIVAVVLLIYGMFPLVFKDFYSSGIKEGEKYSQQQKDKRAPMTEEQWDALVVERIIVMVVAVIEFIWAAFVCVGAFRMGNLESYAWAWVGAIMGLLTCLPVGIWCIMVLNNPIVKDGFAEKKPPEV